MGVFVALTVPAQAAIVLDSPLAPGDVVWVDQNLRNLYQMRGSSIVSTVDFGANREVGGVFSGTDGSLYVASGNTAASSTLAIDRIDVGQATSTTILGASDLVGGSGTGQLRDVAVDPSGNVYTIYTAGANIDKFTPSGGAYSRTALGTFSGLTFGDSGNGHLDISLDGGYVISGSRSQNSVYTMDSATGTVQSASMGGPTNSTMLAQAVLDRVSGDRILFGTASGSTGVHELFEVEFDPASGALGSVVQLSDDGSNVDGMAVDPIGQTVYLARRSSTLRSAPHDELAAARADGSGGVNFDPSTLDTIFSGGQVNVARDLTVISPEIFSVSLGNLFDDDKGVLLSRANFTDEYRASASSSDLGVNNFLEGDAYGAGTPAELGAGTGVMFDFDNVGAGGVGVGGLPSNDTFRNFDDKAIRTEGFSSSPYPTTKVEDGIGMHADELLTFDLDELREAGLPDWSLMFEAKAGLNDDVFGNGSAAARLIAVVSDDDGVLAGYVNGEQVDVALDGSVWSFDDVNDTIPSPLLADGNFALFDFRIPASAKYLTLVATSGGSANADHSVFSGATLTAVPEPAAGLLLLLGGLTGLIRRGRRR
jgi:hypothetical protein